MSYATLAEFKSYISEMTGGVQTVFTVAEDALLQKFLDQADAEIEGQTGRSFGQGSNNHIHYYTKDDVDDKTLHLDADLVSITTLTNGNGAAIASTDYWLLPMNASVTGQNAYDGSYYAIQLKDGHDWQFDTNGRVSVNGRWGWMQGAPVEIVRAAMRIAYWYWVKRNETGATNVAGEALTTESDAYPADVRIVLDRYTRRLVA
jgi:hypothetical protein